MSDPGLDRLQRVLHRALRRAALTRDAKRKLSRRSKDKDISEDYADRLAERARYRALLSEERMDGMRFRWYFTQVQKDIALEELRIWIDSKIAKGDSHAYKAPKMAPRPADAPASNLAPLEPGNSSEAAG